VARRKRRLSLLAFLVHFGIPLLDFLLAVVGLGMVAAGSLNASAETVQTGWRLTIPFAGLILILAAVLALSAILNLLGWLVRRLFG
jgi:hypothetical protein